MWYAFEGVLILKNMVCPGLRLIEVAKPWMVESPAPLTCQSLGGSPGEVFSQAITLTTGGPHGFAALAGRVLTRDSELRSTVSRQAMAARRAGTCRAKRLVTDMSGPQRILGYYPARGQTPGYGRSIQKLDHKMITVALSSRPCYRLHGATASERPGATQRKEASRLRYRAARHTRKC